MKTFLSILFCVQLSWAVQAQNQSDTLVVSDSKTSHLVCPDKVSYVQAGDYSLVMAETVPELSNLVRIRAVRPFEKPTSLTVVCAGRIYSFEVRYGNKAPLTYPVESFHSQDAMTFSGRLMPEARLKELCDRVQDKHRRPFRRRRTAKDGITVRLCSVSLEKDALFFELEIKNKTQMAYDVESFSFWIADKRKTRATNVQEYRIFPDYRGNRISRVPGETRVREVFVFEKMTIPGQRVLKMELNEKALGNTGRDLCLILKNKDILRARKL